MKKIIALFAMLAMVAGIATAAPKKKAEKKIDTVVFTTDLDCHHCAQKVLNTIPYEKGIKDVQVDVPTKTVTVKFDAAKNSIESLTKAFESIKVKVVKTKKVE
ncbi:MAG: cation transporter [Bacteroidaceae bacterium]|nr:cation transporter [Bacteroidaceae bacterium]